MNGTSVLDDLIEACARTGRPCLAVSPHLDDAVLSAGAWLGRIAADSGVLVATAFTEASGPPYSWIARRFVRGSGFTDAGALFQARREEDEQVLAELGLTGIHLGYVDAVFRRSRLGPWSRPAYPTLRFDALQGRVARSDRQLRAALAGRVRELIVRHQPAVVLAPLGVGRHVDHLLVRDAVCDALRDPIAGADRAPVLVFASDQPYALRSGPQPEFIRTRALRPHSWKAGRDRATQVALGYRSQIPVLFAGGTMPAAVETLWTHEADDNRMRD